MDDTDYALGASKADSFTQISGSPARALAARDYNLRSVIVASSVGTLIEMYDFFIFGSLTAVISPLFYPPGNATFAYFAYLATFAIGLVVRPFGALFFGRIGDLVGRKNTFLVTLGIMGGATAGIGMLPTYATAGWFAPIILIAIRALQGLAIGGEYGGAAVYVAEHAPDRKRGFYTSFIQIAGQLSNFVSFAMILIVQNSLGQEGFNNWGWRIPFLLSIPLVGISLYIRLRMKESPIFAQLKSAGLTSAQPLKEAFTKWENLRRVLISLFGVVAGVSIVGFTGFWYSFFYLQIILKVNVVSASYIVVLGLLFSVPFFVLFGSLSDRIGRKKFMMAGCLLAALSYLPIYHAMQSAIGFNVATVVSQRSPVTGEITLMPQTRDASGALKPAAIVLPYTNLGGLIGNPIAWKLIMLIFIQMIWYAMAYGPLAAYLVEAFPARIRYTSLSLPYHIGYGFFGGLTPLIDISLVARTGNIYAGLYFPIIVASITFVVGSLLLPETRHIRIWDEAE
jgi:MFS family permease